jgi:hypothetical protein
MCHVGFGMDDDLAGLRNQVVAAPLGLRAGIRAHRNSSE